ncbi:MAG: class 1 fructose-bisphosphatase [Candidatus Diapherotrites archaeon]
MHLEEHLKSVDKDIAHLVNLVAEKAKEIQWGFLSHNFSAGTENIYGEEQLEMDKWADRVLFDAFEECGLVRNVASEEQAEIQEIVKSEGSWGITLDPLDGVSCVETNLAVGTIVGMFNEGNVMEKGSKMDAACYILYGPLTTLVYTAKEGVHEFVLNKDGDFVLRKENIMMPEGNIYGSGGLNKDWTPEHGKYIKDLERQGYKLRYSGSFAADFHQVLYKGGVFTYPALKEKPNGKLRLLFECNPMSFIAKEAGGDSTNGHKSILSIKPEKLDHRVPIYVGSKGAIELAEKYIGGKK